MFKRSSMVVPSMLTALMVSACGGGGGASLSPACPPAQILTFIGGNVGTGSFQTSPLSPATTVLDFSYSNATFVVGTVSLSGSDGSSLAGFPLSAQYLLPDGLPPPSILQYTSSISGLRANNTYTVTVQSLRTDTTFGAPACNYPAQTAGSFRTTAQ